MVQWILKHQLLDSSVCSTLGHTALLSYRWLKNLHLTWNRIHGHLRPIDFSNSKAMSLLIGLITFDLRAAEPHVTPSGKIWHVLSIVTVSTFLYQPNPKTNPTAQQ